MPEGIPESILPLWEHLNSEVVRLHAKWKIYRQLYGTSPERVNLLNAVAGWFFRVIEDTLFDDVVLSLTRLTDRVATNKSRENAVLEQLLQSAEIKQISALNAKLEAQLASLRTSCEEFRKIRNKRISHSDLQIALNEAVLPGVSRQMVEDALHELRSFMNSVELHFSGSHTAYEHFFSISDGEAIILALKQAKAFEQAERDEIISEDYFGKTQYADD